MFPLFPATQATVSRQHFPKYAARTSNHSRSCLEPRRILLCQAQPIASGPAKHQDFINELRSYAMKLHTKEQAPKEGQAEAPRHQQWNPTPQGYLHFLVESKVVYEAFDDILSSGSVPYYKSFWNTGLERTKALTQDIGYMESEFSLVAPTPSDDGPGNTYASLLKQLAASNPPAFLCHYYNFYFAHTAGGRMIGQKVSQLALNGWMGEFYKWDGDVKELLSKVRGALNAVAEEWSREEKDACLEETPTTFKYSGTLLALISEQ